MISLKKLFTKKSNAVSVKLPTFKHKYIKTHIFNNHKSIDLTHIITTKRGTDDIKITLIEIPKEIMEYIFNSSWPKS